MIIRMACLSERRVCLNAVFFGTPAGRAGNIPEPARAGAATESVRAMLEQLDKLRDEALGDLEGLGEVEALPEWYRSYLGRKGRLTEVLRGLGRLPPEERPRAGQKGNEVKQALEAAFGERQEALREAALEASLTDEPLDITLPGTA